MSYYLLFNLFNPISWTEGQTANIINSFAAAGTVGALAYAFFLERKNRNKIDTLSNIVKELSEANIIFREQTVLERKKMKPFSRPEIKLLNAFQNKEKNCVDLTIINEGQYAQKLTYKSQGNVKFFSDVPTTISKGPGLALIGKLDAGVTFSEIFYLVEVRYEDYFGNVYNTVIIGRDNSHRLLQTDDI